MHHVGIDLAWGEKNPTGLAVLDQTGRLVHVSTVRTDDEILVGLAPYADGPCVVALDAPLVVTNPTGKRPAEKALDADFRRFEAGTHPSNTGKKEFADGTRGARVGRLLRLDLDPRSGRDRRAIEVYPHAATVALFRLERTLKYKDKPGRTLDSLRAELLVLMGHLEGVPELELGAAWAALRTDVEDATRKSGLRVVEDQVDAVVCALVARIADLRPRDLTFYGDPATGTIITPTLPRDLRPAGAAVDPRQGDGRQAAIQTYADAREDTLAAAGDALALVTELLDEAGINYLSVTGRAKTVASFAEKATRSASGVPLYPEPLRDITDQLGVRVITYVQSDVEAVADLLGAQVVVHDDRDLGRETASEGRFGYASRHLLIGLDAAREREYAALRGRIAQVQIRTVLQHAWAEFEHDIRYKGTVPDQHASEFDRRFTLAAGLLELADREFTAIRDRLRAAPVVAAPDDDPDDPRLAPKELAAFLAGQYDDAGWSRPDHYAWISGLLLELGVTSLDELAEVLRAADDAVIAERMDYRYPPGAVRRLDDALLATQGQRYVDLHGNAHRTEALAARLARLTDSP